MAIELTGIVVKHERRLRLVFSNELAAGAFGTGPAPVEYVVESSDGRGLDPTVLAAIAVLGAVTNVELALDVDLVKGALYRVRAIGVPATDLSTSTSASDQLFRFGESPKAVNVEPKTSHADRVLFGSDAVWTGVDYLENVQGDLEEVVGPGNAHSALRRRLTGAPLAWAPGYSPRARHLVDAPIPSVGGLKGRLQQQALLDDRVRSVDVTFDVDPTNGEDSIFSVTPTFRGNRTAEPIAIETPT